MAFSLLSLLEVDPYALRGQHELGGHRSLRVAVGNLADGEHIALVHHHELGLKLSRLLVSVAKLCAGRSSNSRNLFFMFCTANTLRLILICNYVNERFLGIHIEL